MDTILIAVTVMSLALAAGMGAMLLRTLRLERRRSDARVELLEAMAAGSPESQPTSAPQRRTSASPPALQRTRVSTHFDQEVAPPTRAIEDFELRPGATPSMAGPHIFEEHEAPSAWPRRFAVIGALSALLCIVFIGWRASGASDSIPAAPNQTAQQAQASAPALELLSLRHEQQDGTLVISGLVQNARGSAPVAGVQATVVLFDAGGATLATSRAPIDFMTLSPGDESSFVIRIPAAGAVARYRVGFRGEDDRVLGHVDRRNNETVARKQTP